MSAPSSSGRRAFWRGGLPALGASLTLLAACAQIVGITDTVVTDDGGLADTGGATGGDSGAEGGNALGQPDAVAEGGSTLVEPDANALPETSPPRDGGVDGPSADSSEGGDAGQRPADAGPDQASPVDASPDQATADSGGCGTCPVDKPTCAAGQCTVRGPTMVQVDTFYIDSTEVTVAQYQQFLAAKGTDTSGQPSVCAWNNAYRDPTVALNPGTWPMTNVDWCDALAYCTWAGKHLCGRIGGGPIASADALTASASQWFLACGGGGTHPNTNSMCNSSGGTRSLAPVATFPRCEGFYPGIFDMEGNAAEWVDSCDSTAGATDTCHLLGGSYIDNLSYCTESFDEPRNTTADPFGFRCCGG